MNQHQIYSRPEWKNAALCEGVRISFEIIDECILHTTSSGDFSRIRVREIFQLRSAIIEEFFRGEPFGEIRSFGAISGMPSWTERYRHVKGLKESPGRFVALALCCPPMTIRRMYQLGSFLYGDKNLRLFFCDALEESISSVREVIQEHKVQLQIITRPEWNWKSPDGSLEFENQVIPGRAWITKFKGVAGTEHADRVDKILRDIFGSGLLDHSRIWRVADYTEMEGASFRSRLSYATGMRDLLKKHSTSIVHHAVCGANWTVRASILFLQSLFKHSYVFYPTFEEGLEAMHAFYAPSPGLKPFSRPEEVAHRPPTITEIDDLIRVAGTLLIDPAGSIVPPKYSPFSMIYEALDLLRKDLCEERERSRELDQIRKIHEARLEQALEQARVSSEEILRISEAKGKFFSTMSHEIRTPLNGIIGLAEMLLHTPLTAEQKQMIELIHKSGKSLLDIINDILDFSKIEAGHMKLEKVDFSLRDLVDDILALLGSKAQEQKNELFSVFPSAFPERITGDPNRIRQVLINLVGNSLKFTEKGVVFLSVEAQSLSDRVYILHFAVEDTGIGMSPEAVGALFQPFRQAGSEVSRKYGGTGLGLMISQSLVNAMGGKIEVRSSPGKGSVFEFSIRAEAPGIVPGEVFKSPIKGWKVFVCDGCERRRRALQDHLLGLEALFSENTGLYDLVIADEESCSASVSSRLRIILTGGLPQYAGDLEVLHHSDRLLMKPLRWRALKDLLVQLSGGGPPPEEARTLGIRNLSLRVLVAEDNSVNRKIAGLMLDKIGCTFRFAENGREVLERLSSESFDVCLMDCHMPVMDGFETTRRIRSGEAGSEASGVSIIALTAGVEPEEKKKCLDSGMDGFLPKPLEFQELYQVLEKYTKR